MKLKKIAEEDVPEKVPAGLSDGGHVYPRCGGCNAVLMDIHVTRPHESDVWKIRANCPFCGGMSNTVEVQGGFHPGGYGLPKEDDPTDDIPVTIWETFDMNGDTFYFQIKKANHDVQPIRY